MTTRESISRHVLAAGVAALCAACGGAATDAGGATAPDAGAPDDAGAPTTDASLPDDVAIPDDAALPVCPLVYSVYGDLDASDNLGGINPTLYASGTCTGATEQYVDIDAGALGIDGGIAPTDLTVTLQQSAPRSGMFVTVIHQTTPFPFDLTTCLQSAGHGTGSSPGPDLPGTMALVNDPENEFFPQVQLDTNLDGTSLVFDVALSVTASFTPNTIDCTFMKN